MLMDPITSVVEQTVYLRTPSIQNYPDGLGNALQILGSVGGDVEVYFYICVCFKTMTFDDWIATKIVDGKQAAFNQRAYGHPTYPKLFGRLAFVSRGAAPPATGAQIVEFDRNLKNILTSNPSNLFSSKPTFAFSHTQIREFKRDTPADAGYFTYFEDMHFTPEHIADSIPDVNFINPSAGDSSPWRNIPHCYNCNSSLGIRIEDLFKSKEANIPLRSWDDYDKLRTDEGGLPFFEYRQQRKLVHAWLDKHKAAEDAFVAQQQREARAIGKGQEFLESPLPRPPDRPVFPFIRRGTDPMFTPYPAPAEIGVERNGTWTVDLANLNPLDYPPCQFSAQINEYWTKQGVNVSAWGALGYIDTHPNASLYALIAPYTDVTAPPCSHFLENLTLMLETRGADVLVHSLQSTFGIIEHAATLTNVLASSETSEDTLLARAIEMSKQQLEPEADSADSARESSTKRRRTDGPLVDLTAPAPSRLDPRFAERRTTNVDETGLSVVATRFNLDRLAVTPADTPEPLQLILVPAALAPLREMGHGSPLDYYSRGGLAATPPIYLDDLYERLTRPANSPLGNNQSIFSVVSDRWKARLDTTIMLPVPNVVFSGGLHYTLGVLEFKPELRRLDLFAGDPIWANQPRAAAEKALPLYSYVFLRYLRNHGTAEADLPIVPDEVLIRSKIMAPQTGGLICGISTLAACYAVVGASTPAGFVQPLVCDYGTGDEMTLRAYFTSVAADALTPENPKAFPDDVLASMKSWITGGEAATIVASAEIVRESRVRKLLEILQGVDAQDPSEDNTNMLFVVFENEYLPTAETVAAVIPGEEAPTLPTEEEKTLYKNIIRATLFYKQDRDLPADLAADLPEGLSDQLAGKFRP